MPGLLCGNRVDETYFKVKEDGGRRKGMNARQRQRTSTIELNMTLPSIQVKKLQFFAQIQIVFFQPRIAAKKCVFRHIR